MYILKQPLDDAATLKSKVLIATQEGIVIAWKKVATSIALAKARRRTVFADGHQRLIQSHWTALSKAGISASKLIEFLQPLADSEGLSVYELPVTQINATSTIFGLASNSVFSSR